MRLPGVPQFLVTLSVQVEAPSDDRLPAGRLAKPPGISDLTKDEQKET
jgi:hypothetical protein